ncbi:MAG: hypothetical protein LH618_19170 [Saprospiraceae bacterium]|nr:hypothetical protein [Saprospiraceae bacterium]
MKYIVLIGLFMVNAIAALAQDRIRLKNPSFEARGSYSVKLLNGWVGLGGDSETPPDIQPGKFKVELPAQEGDNYIGLVVRENNTWEGLGQELNGFLQKDSTYSFSIHLAHSDQLMSRTKKSSEAVNFRAPTILRIWGHNIETKQDELLAQSPIISHREWARYIFTLQPTLSSFNELNLVAYYAPGFEQQNGNLLIDNCSPILKIEK